MDWPAVTGAGSSARPPMVAGDSSSSVRAWAAARAVTVPRLRAGAVGHREHAVFRQRQQVRGAVQRSGVGERVGYRFHDLGGGRGRQRVDRRVAVDVDAAAAQLEGVETVSPLITRLTSVASTIASMSGRMMEYSPVSSNMMIGARATPVKTAPMPTSPYAPADLHAFADGSHKRTRRHPAWAGYRTCT